MIPLLVLNEIGADTERLRDLFKEDPGLRQVRFNAGEVAAWFIEVSHERPSQRDEANAWLDGVAARFASKPDRRRVVETLTDRLVEAAPRWSESPGDLRCLALGLIFASVATKDDGPNTLTSILFRLTLQEGFQER